MKKRGFTLIELLAVIIILAVILVIAIPKILDVIEEAEMQSYKESVQLMVHTAKLQYETKEIQGLAPQIPEDGIIYKYGYDETKKDTIQTNIDEVGLLDFKGDKPRSGTITLNKNKKVEVIKLVSKMKNGKYCAIKSYEGEVIVGKSSDPDFNCTVDSDEQVKDDTPCELATENKDGKEYYYIDSVEDMYAFSDNVNSGNSYSGKIVKLRNNLNFSNYSKQSKPKVCKNNDNVDGFTPIGNDNNRFNGTFEGNAKTISNLIINRPNENYVGIFGYAYEAIVRGLKLNNINITGSTYVGGLIGNQNSGVTSYIELKDVVVTGSNKVSSISGEAGSGQLKNNLIKSATISSNNEAGYIGTSIGNSFYNIIENENITGTTIQEFSNIFKSNSIIKNNQKINDGFPEKNKGDINYYESTGMNTWIGGDNDNLGYYYDYDSEAGKNIVLKSTENVPIPSNINNVLEKQGDFYLINNISDWKNMSAFVSDNLKFKLTSNLNFSNKHFYMMGSEHNRFSGVFDGSAKTISNVSEDSTSQNYVGLFGKTISATIYGLNLDNINMKGNAYVGGLVGLHEEGRIYEISIKNSSIEGSDRISGISGEANYSNINNILIKSVNIKSNSFAGLVGINMGGYNNLLVENANVTSTNLVNANEIKSNNVIHNGTPVAGGFNSSYIDNLEYYSGKIETRLDGDNNSSGYYFEYDQDKNGIYVVPVHSNDGWELINSESPITNQKWIYWQNGERIQSGFHVLKDFSNNNQTYYFENGVVAVGFKTINGKKYYFSEKDELPANNYVDANMIHNQTITINGQSYTFDSEGICTNCN